MNTNQSVNNSLSGRNSSPSDYFQLDDDFPEYVQIQRTPGTISGNRVTFNAQTFDPNLFLRSRAYLKLNVDFKKQLRIPPADPIDDDWNDNDVIYKKPGMVLANSMTNIKIRINNTEITYDEPRYWQQKITEQHCGRELNDKYLSTSGSSYPTYTGVFNPDGTVVVDLPSDQGIQEAIDSAYENIQPTVENIKNFEFMELLNVGPFNFMADNKDKIYKKSWYKKMTGLIPYVRQIGLTIDFKDIAANSLIFLYGRITALGDRLTISDVNITNAELVLTWVKPRGPIQIPRTVKIQSYYVDHRKFQVLSDVPPVATDIIPWNAPFSFNETMTIHQIPTYIHIWATINKDDITSYQCRSISADVDGAGLNQTTSFDQNSQESRGLPTTGIDIRVNVLGGDTILDSGYNNKEMYRFTTKNSIKDFPWNRTKFENKIFSKYAIYPSNFSLILAEDDLNSFSVRKGQTIRDFQINVKGTMITNDGYGFDRTVVPFNIGGEKRWDLHVAFFYDRYYIELDNCGNGFAEFDSNFF